MACISTGIARAVSHDTETLCSGLPSYNKSGIKYSGEESPFLLDWIAKLLAGDSHTAALTELGAVYSWGVFRGNSGPFAFLPGTPFALEPELVYTPQSAQSQIVQISSGSHLWRCMYDAILGDVESECLIHLRVACFWGCIGVKLNLSCGSGNAFEAQSLCVPLLWECISALWGCTIPLKQANGKHASIFILRQ